MPTPPQDPTPLTLDIPDRLRDDVMTWLEDSESEFTELVASLPGTRITLPTSVWVSICQGLYGHAREFGGTYARSADSLAERLTSAVGGRFDRGVWTPA